jgi:chromosomal replication initiator protein
MMSNKELWQNALVQIELGTSEASFRTWFRNTDILNRDSGTVHIAVPSKIVKEWLMDKHHKLILKRFAGSTAPSHRRIRGASLSALCHPCTASPAPENASLDLQSLYIDKRDNLNPRYTFDTFVIGPFNELAVAAQRPSWSARVLSTIRFLSTARPDTGKPT